MRPTTSRTATGLALAGPLAVALALGWTTPEAASDLRPRPDALEYEEAARSLVAGRGYAIVVDGLRYPPRYPFGFSLLLAPVLALADRGPGTGVVVTAACAVAGVAGAFALGRLLGGVPGGVVAALVVALSPAHVRAARGVMSDVPAAAAATWILVAVATALRQQGGLRWAAIGVAIGLATTIRLACATLVVPVAVAAIATWRRRAWHPLAALAAGTALALMPLLAYDAAVTGSPLATPYAAWAPATYFSWRYAVGAPVGGGTAANLAVYGRALAGWGPLYPWPIAVLAVVGAAVAAAVPSRRATLGLVVAWTATALALQAAFFWQDTRFLVAVVPAVGALAGAAFAGGARVRGVAAALALGALLLLVRAPGAWARPRPAEEASTLREMARVMRLDAAVLVRTNDHFFATLVRAGTDRVWVPLGRNAHETAVAWFRVPPLDPAATRPSWIDLRLAGRFDARTAERTVHALLGAGRPVYASTLLADEAPFMTALVTVLRSHFTVRRVRLATRRWKLYRVWERDESPQRVAGRALDARGW